MHEKSTGRRAQPPSPPRDELRVQGEQGEQVHVDPAVSSRDSEETQALAYSQTLSARATLYWPSEELANELGIAANGLNKFIDFIEDEPELIIGLCARLLGPEGLDPQEFFKKGAVKDSGELAKLCKQTLRGHLSNVVKDSIVPGNNPKLGHSRAVTIALLGDVGAFMAATGATTGTERSVEVSKGLKDAFTAYALSLENKEYDKEEGLALVNESVKRCKELGGGEVVGPTKSKERKRVPGEDLIARTGIHDCGREVDEVLGRFEQEGHLVPTKWASARLQEERVRVTGEPLAGHMSASPSEILWTWDVLAGRGLESAYIGSALHNGDPHSPARAAGACAFLVGCGYHSALEVLHGTLNYEGQTLDKAVLIEAAKTRCKYEDIESLHEDAGAIFYAGAATSLMNEIMDGMTSEAGKQAKIPPEEPVLEEEEQQSSSLLSSLKANLGKVVVGIGLAVAFAATVYAVTQNNGPK